MEQLYQEFEIMQPTSNTQLKQWLISNNVTDCEIILPKEKSKKNYNIKLLSSPPHWVFLDNINRKVFDSYGSGPGIWYYDKELFNYEPIYVYNIFQSPNTAVCGEYCCLYYKFKENFINYFTPITCTPETWKTACLTPMNPLRMRNDAKCLDMWWKDVDSIFVKHKIRNEFQ